MNVPQVGSVRRYFDEKNGVRGAQNAICGRTKFCGETGAAVMRRSALFLKYYCMIQDAGLSLDVELYARQEEGMEERRRCKRLPMNIPVKVYGRTPDNLPFRDESVTKYVNSHGALLPLVSRLKRGQTVLLVNSFTGEERQCRVVYVDPKSRGKNRVAVEFMERKGDFWHVFAPMVRLKNAESDDQVA